MQRRTSQDNSSTGSTLQRESACRSNAAGSRMLSREDRIFLRRRPQVGTEFAFSDKVPASGVIGKCRPSMLASALVTVCLLAMFHSCLGQVRPFSVRLVCLLVFQVEETPLFSCGSFFLLLQSRAGRAKSIWVQHRVGQRFS